MTVRCQACDQPQQPGWLDGDLCGHCGAAVRIDTRCFWCARWTPLQGYCRHCGAEVVPPALYGAARMLKDAGSDRFSIPVLLRTLPPPQIDNFTRLYQRHGAVAAQHVDDLAFAERFLRQRGWSRALDDRLQGELPWDDATFAENAPLDTRDLHTDLDRARSLEAHSPFELTRTLARIARLRLGDLTVVRGVADLLGHEDPRVGLEAALALSSWRVVHSSSWGGGTQERLRGVLEASDHPEARLGLALVTGQTIERGHTEVTDGDAELRFALALASRDVETLRGALSGADELAREAAGASLLELGETRAVLERIASAALSTQRAWLGALASRDAVVPEGGETLVAMVETSGDGQVRERAARVLCRALEPAWTLRVARAARGERTIFQSLLQAKQLTPEAAVDLGRFLVEHGHFSMSQYGISELARGTTMPDGWVPTIFAGADPQTRLQLLRFAEEQLGARGNEALHRFVTQEAFGDGPAEQRAAAWWTLHRWYRQLGDHRGEGPVALSEGWVTRFFTSIALFEPRLVAVLRDPATLKEVGYFEMLAHLLGSADEATVVGLMDVDLQGGAVTDALVTVVAGDYWTGLVDAAVTLAARVGDNPARRETLLRRLEPIVRRGNYHHDRALDRLAQRSAP